MFRKINLVENTHMFFNKEQQIKCFLATKENTANLLNSK